MAFPTPTGSLEAADHTLADVRVMEADPETRLMDSETPASTNTTPADPETRPTDFETPATAITDDTTNDEVRQTKIRLHRRRHRRHRRRRRWLETICSTDDRDHIGDRARSRDRPSGRRRRHRRS